MPDANDKHEVYQPMLWRFAVPFSRKLPSIGYFDEERHIWIVNMDEALQPLIFSHPLLTRTMTLSEADNDPTDED